MSRARRPPEPARPLLTTVPHDFKALTPSRLAAWEARADVVDRRDLSRVELVRRLVAAARSYPALLLDGSVGTPELYSDLIAAAVISRRRLGASVVISDCSWKLGSSRLDRAACRAGIRAIDAPRVTYCVLSSAEVELFARTWGVDGGRVVFTPFCYTFTDDELAAPSTSDGRVFAGGDSLRDYEPLVEAARELGFHLDLATGALSEAVRAALPPTVRVGSVSHARFIELMRLASVVVVPLREGIERSAGQQTYLNAMAMGKIVIASDSPGARDYVEHGLTGLIVPAGDARALAGALAWCLDAANSSQVEAMRAEAARVARERFSPDAYFESLLAVVDDALARNGG